jgi:ribose transport system substrate-binding protein
VRLDAARRDGTARRPRLLALATLCVLALVSVSCVSIVNTPSDGLAGDPAVSPSAVPSPFASGVVPSPPSEPLDPSATGGPDLSPGASPASEGTRPPRATGASSSPEASSPLIGYIALDDRVPFGREVSEGIRAAAELAGAELLSCDPGLLGDAVLACARRLGEAGVDGVISFQPFADLGDEACDAYGGVPTVGIAVPQGDCQVAIAATDDREVGRTAGAAVGAFVRDRWGCDITAWVSLESRDAEGAASLRMQGYRDGYEEACSLEGKRTWRLAGADRLATAESQVSRLLTALPGRRVIVVGLNEDAVAGALSAARRAGRSDDVWVSGIGADPSARSAIACDRRYIASVALHPERYGELVVPALLAALEREGASSAERVLDVPFELVTRADIRAVFPDIPPCSE